jgi:hypothetical protein
MRFLKLELKLKSYLLLSYKGACTNRIESLWNSSKHRFKEIRGCKRSYIQSFLDEFVWRFNNGVHNDRVAAYNLILKTIAKFYKPGTQ